MANRKIVVFGIDPSLTGFAYTIMSSEYCGDIKAKSGTIKTKATDGDIIDRSMIIIKELLPRMNKGDYVFMEDYAFASKNTNSLTGLAELGGIFKLMVAKKTSRRVIPVATTTLKKWITGKGNTKKEQIPLFVYKKFGVELPDNDQTFSYGLADFGYHLLGCTSRNLNKTEKAMISDHASKIKFGAKK